MNALLTLVACGDGTAEVRADLEEKGLTVLEVEVVESDKGQRFAYAGTRDGQFCSGDIGQSGGGLGCVSSTSSATSEVCASAGGSFEQSWRCDHRNDGSACNDAGVVLYKDGKPEAFARMERGCSLGFAEACRNAGVIVKDGLVGRLADPAAASVWFEKGCNAGSGLACMQRGMLSVTKDDPSGCHTVSSTWYERGVALSHPMTTNELGVLLDHCEDGDKVRARAMFQKACDLGYGMGCSNLGGMLLGGRGGDADQAAAVKAFEAGCVASDPSVKSCVKRANNGPAAEATVWLGKACDGGDLGACLDFGVGLINENASDQGAAMLAAFQKACDGADATGCRNVGVVKRDGLLGIAKGADEAHAMFVKACDMGDRPACMELKK